MRCRRTSRPSSNSAKKWHVIGSARFGDGVRRTVRVGTVWHLVWSAGYPWLVFSIPGRQIGSTPGPKVGARCGNSARRVLCGGPRATGVPTATSHRKVGQHVIGDVGRDLGHAPRITVSASS